MAKLSNFLREEGLHLEIKSDPYFSCKEAAIYMECSLWWLYWHRKQATGPAYSVKSLRKIVYRKSDLDKFILARRVAA